MKGDVMFLELTLKFVFLFSVVLGASYALSKFLFSVYFSTHQFRNSFAGKAENFFFHFIPLDFTELMDYKTYLKNYLLLFIYVIVLFYVLLNFQTFFSLESETVKPLSTDMILHTILSYLTGTNIQTFSPETQLNLFSQALVLTPLQFIAPAFHICAVLPLIRGLLSEGDKKLGNFWNDFFRTIFFILLPISLIASLILVCQGVVQSLTPFIDFKGIENIFQKFALGPVASQSAISILGNNGGGYLASNFSHPFANPTPLSNLTYMFLMLLLPSALIFTYGRVINQLKHAWSLWICLTILFAISLFAACYFETRSISYLIPQQNFIPLEGKEMRFGLVDSILFSQISISTNTGAANSILASYHPLSLFAFLTSMATGGVVFGAFGAGLQSVICVVLLAIFFSGLMVGNTPEYLGKKIEAEEVKYLVIPLIISVLTVCLTTLLALFLPSLNESLSTDYRRFTQIIYNCFSALFNNGTILGSVTNPHPLWHVLFSLSELVGKLATVVCGFFLAGRLSEKVPLKTKASELREKIPISGTLFIFLCLATIFLSSIITYLPPMVLGPALEYFLVFSK